MAPSFERGQHEGEEMLFQKHRASIYIFIYDYYHNTDSNIYFRLQRKLIYLYFTMKVRFRWQWPKKHEKAYKRSEFIFSS